MGSFCAGANERQRTEAGQGCVLKAVAAGGAGRTRGRTKLLVHLPKIARTLRFRQNTARVPVGDVQAGHGLSAGPEARLT